MILFEESVLISLDSGDLDYFFESARSTGFCINVLMNGLKVGLFGAKLSAGLSRLVMRLFEAC